MNEMINRVARAIADISCDPSKETPASCEALSHNCQCMKQARAAIAEMREPTEAMVWSGERAQADTKHIWQAMIDAALKED